MGWTVPQPGLFLPFSGHGSRKKAENHPALTSRWEEILAGGNLVFRYDGTFVHQDTQLQQAWDRHYQTEEDNPQMVCLVTRECRAVENIHPPIKNVQGAQSSGATLVSFNAPAFCYYGKEQNYNAPTSKYAAFAYTTALNHLLFDREHVYRMRDTTCGLLGQMWWRCLSEFNGLGPLWVGIILYADRFAGSSGQFVQRTDGETG